MDQMISVHASDLAKIYDALDRNTKYFRKRDEANCLIHAAQAVRYSPITSATEAERDRVEALFRDAGIKP